MHHGFSYVVERAGLFLGKRLGVNPIELGEVARRRAHELAPHDIRVNAVAPGLIEVEGERVSAEYKRNFLPNIPAGRVGQPKDIAELVAFLVSDKADFIHGACVPVDGGFLTGRKLIRAGSR